jgi:hypothetical protein
MSKSFNTFYINKKFIIFTIFFNTIYINLFSCQNKFYFFYTGQLFNAMKKLEKNNNTIINGKNLSEESQIFIQEQFKSFKENGIEHKLISIFNPPIFQIHFNNNPIIYYSKTKDKGLEAIVLFKNNNENKELIGFCGLKGGKTDTISDTFIKEKYRRFSIGTIIRSCICHKIFGNGSKTVFSCTTPDSYAWHLKQPGSKISDLSRSGYCYTETTSKDFYKDLKNKYSHLNLYEGMAQNIFDKKMIEQINDNYNNKNQ